MRKKIYFQLTVIMIFCPFLLLAQENVVTGIVTDNTTGETLPGVSIAIKGTTKGVITDINGTFQISANKGETLIFSYVGYNEQNVTVSNQKKLSIRMESATLGLDEVVVVGYGTQSKRTMTSAISKVDGKTLKSAPINTVGEGLKGKIAGVRVYNDNNTPGAEANFLIRGGSSISQNNSPLILIDGIERTTAGINPNDIESIEVLKDAASSAIYGSRASNGVVLITTKKGGKSAPRITFEASLANENVERMIEYLDATQAVTIMRDRWSTGPKPEKLYLDGYAYSSGNTSSSKFSTRYLQDGETIPDGWKSVADPLDPSKTLIFEDNNWSKTCFKNALWQNYYIGIDGGNEKLSYVGSIGYMKDSGVGVGTAFDRFNARTNVNAQIRDNLSFSANIDYSQTNSEEYASQYQVISRGLMTPPTQRKYWVSDNEWYGTPTPGPNASSPNPAFYSYFNENSRKVNRLGLVGSLDWEILKGWHAVGTASLFTSNNNGDTFMKANPMNGTRKATTDMTDEQRKKLEFYTNYSKTIADKHSFSAMLGYSYQRYLYKYVNAATTGHSSDKIPTLNGGSTFANATSIKQEDVNIGYFGRFNYDYQKKYLLTLTFREDGSSRFSKDNRWGFFPGLSIGWVMSDESFMKNLDFISNFKWRISYGQTGNNSIGYYDALGLYAITTSYNHNASTVSSAMPNSSLEWETSTQLDLGFDLGLLKNRIILGFDYFNKTTDNLITSKVLPNTSGYNSILTNVGKVRFRGFDAEITTRNIVKKDFTWETKFTITYVKNKVLQLPDNGRDRNRQGGYSVKMQDGSTYEFGGIAEGEPLGRFYGYKKDFIITTAEQAANARYDTSSKGWDWTTQTKMGVGKKTIGDYEWKDLNGDNIINSNDMYLLGNTIPHTTGGLNNTFTYKGFTLNIYLDFALGHSISNGYLQRQMCNFMNGNTSLPTEILKCWNVGDDPNKAKYARFSGNDSDELNKNFRDNSDVFTQKADYLCIREVSLQYEIPQIWLQKIGIKAATLSLAGNNLHYFTDVIGLSPEMGASSTYSGSFMTYPPIRKLSIGCKITL